MNIMGREPVGASSRKASENRIIQLWTTRRFLALARVLRRVHVVTRCVLQCTNNKRLTSKVIHHSTDRSVFLRRALLRYFRNVTVTDSSPASRTISRLPRRFVPSGQVT